MAAIVPDPGSLHLERPVADEDRITIAVTASRQTATCPDCGLSPLQVQSRYRRAVAGLS